MKQYACNSIVIPVDFSETSLLAIRHAAFMAQYNKAKLCMLHVINVNFGALELFVPVIDAELMQSIEKKAQQRLNELANELANEFQIEVTTELRSGSASKHIVEYAKSINADIMVMGTHGYSPFEELIIGSTALKVLVKSHCPVIAMRKHETHKGYSNILMPIDLSPHTAQKARYTLELAKTYGAGVHILGLLHEDEHSKLPVLKTLIYEIEEMAKHLHVHTHTFINTDVKNRAVSTVTYAKENNVDLICIMTDQDAELSGFFLGPYTQQIIHHSQVPVLALKPKTFSSVNDSGFYSTAVGF